MKKYLALTLLLCLMGCSISNMGQPPRETSYWRLSKNVHPNRTFEEYVEIREKDMRACGIDPFVGYALSAKAGLCMEAKGWYETAGPICEQEMYQEQDPETCRKWRAKRGQ